jgi:antitoxin CcdA
MNAEKPIRRKSTNVSLDAALVAEAREFGINLSRACEAGLSAEVREARKRKWVEENWEAIQGWNKWVAENGLPLAKYRQF